MSTLVYVVGTFLTPHTPLGWKDAIPIRLQLPSGFYV